ncbi:hypothetical protein E2K80_01340 [Rhodophyticola sp. CCM32]|uniref:HNH endonuclease signature motif containing protein n=1 Tax=Rhodophyticola sp. CCM32 TaxID=2916397 RepID=UPI00107F0023|nr:HNH endonuclease [Rhodophyticola sp. CCM32]QBX99536.1 hypothetical protein E2K80_01340 [Rhodophyticola sp. CCM32]
MNQSFSEFLRSGGEGEFLLRKSTTGMIGRRVGWSVKNALPNYSSLRAAFEGQLGEAAAENASMLLAALAESYDPLLEEQDLPNIDTATNETLAVWDQRLARIRAEWHSHPQRLRPLRLAMEERLLRSYAGLINEIRQRELGIEQYTWETVGDERVRAGHAALDGRVFRWDSDGERPGEAPNCRCSARPVPPDTGIGVLGPLGLLDRFLGTLDEDFSAGLGVRPQSFSERLRDLFQPEPGVTIDGEMLDIQTQGDLAVAFQQLGDAIKDDPGAFLDLIGRYGEGFDRLASVFGITNAEALMTAAALAASGAPEALVNEALTQSRSAIDRFVGGTATSLVDIADAIRNIPNIRWSDIRRVAQALYADPSALPEAMVEPFRERIAVGDYAGALGYALPEVIAGVAALGRVRNRAEGLSAPEELTLERLQTDPDFEGILNAGSNAPRFERWINQGGNVELMPEGHFRYSAEIDVQGQRQRVSVEYPEGYPDFTPFMTHPSGVRSVEIEVSGHSRTDNRRANTEAGHPEWGSSPPAGWVWHHVEDARTMQLIPLEINRDFYHLGGASIARNQ